jgi:hypothetical protein
MWYTNVTFPRLKIPTSSPYLSEHCAPSTFKEIGAVRNDHRVQKNSPVRVEVHEKRNTQNIWKPRRLVTFTSMFLESHVDAAIEPMVFLMD